MQATETVSWAVPRLGVGFWQQQQSDDEDEQEEDEPEDEPREEELQQTASRLSGDARALTTALKGEATATKAAAESKEESVGQNKDTAVSGAGGKQEQEGKRGSVRKDQTVDKEVWEADDEPERIMPTARVLIQGGATGGL